MKAGFILVGLCLVGMVCAFVQILTREYELAAHVMFVTFGLVGTIALRSLSTNC